MRLLVGLDNREGGKDALELARVLSGDQGASAHVACVLFTGPLPLDYAILPAAEAHEAEPLFAEAVAKLAGVDVETVAYGGGSPAGILTSLAEQEEFDAIVVGSPHRGPIGRVMVGSVANSLLSGAPTDVAVAPKGYAETEHQPPRLIAVGYDGTPESKRALQHAEALARRFGAKLQLITVVIPAVAPPVMVPGVYAGQSPPMPERVIEEGLAAVGEGVAAETRRLDGDPATELIQVSEELDLLVVGSRGYGPVSRALLGSVSRPVANKAACPVVVVRRP
jgi:nucleotide-binding universal stress UspA family protein